MSGLLNLTLMSNIQPVFFLRGRNKAKLSGIIASAQDIKLARTISKDIKIFCPGIRGDQNYQDQKRTLSYKEFNDIADDKCFAVIGRPIYEGNPLENIKKIINSAK